MLFRSEYTRRFERPCKLYFGYMAKAVAALQAPYELTAFLDTDTFVCSGATLAALPRLALQLRHLLSRLAERALLLIDRGEPIRIVAAGLSRSGSTWQFNALRLILQHAIRTYGGPGSKPEAHSAHGHTMDEIQGCSGQF